MNRFFIVSQAYRDGIYVARDEEHAIAKFTADGGLNDTCILVEPVSRHDISLAAHEKPRGGSLAETLLWKGV